MYRLIASLIENHVLHFQEILCYKSSPSINWYGLNVWRSSPLLVLCFQCWNRQDCSFLLKSIMSNILLFWRQNLYNFFNIKRFMQHFSFTFFQLLCTCIYSTLPFVAIDKAFLHLLNKIWHYFQLVFQCVKSRTFMPNLALIWSFCVLT